MTKELIKSLPIQFEQMSNILDNRFMKVKIWIAHTGENRNNSIFTKEVLESMIPSLSNVPILGYIGVNSDDEEDFRGHGERLVIENGNEFKLKYVGRAWGTIPETNNARFEERYGEDGIKREYLVCEGVVWNKFPEVADIFDRDGGFKWQSMELEHSSVDGEFNEDGVFVFTKAKFEGACILGEDVTPAMVSSTIEKFSVSTIKQDLNEMLTEFNAYFSTFERGETMEENTIIEPVVEPTVEDVVEPVVEPVVEEPVKFTRTFELSHEDIRSGLYDAMDAHDSFKESWMWISQVFENHFIAEGDGKWYKVNYVKHESAVSLGEFEELFPMFLTQGEKATIDASRNNFEALEQEVVGLREFKASIELEDKKQHLAKYSTVLSKEEYETISENLVNFSVEEIEKEVGFMLLKKNHFSANTEGDTAPVGGIKATNVNVANPYGSASVYFSK